MDKRGDNYDGSKRSDYRDKRKRSRSREYSDRRKSSYDHGSSDNHRYGESSGDYKGRRGYQSEHEEEYRDYREHRADKNYRDYRDSSRDDRGHKDYREHKDDREHKDCREHRHNIYGKRDTPSPATNRYDLPTTESLHAKKLVALDHEKFLQDRQRERMSRGAVEGLWPKTPPRAEFYFGENFEKSDEGTAIVDDFIENSFESETVEPVNVKQDLPVDDEEEFVTVKVKAPSATKPSINSFSTAKATKYGGDLMPGEGTAMAGFIAQGQRIPRRGEIGLDSDQISRFETAGYVMSGSRHHLMNAVRMRKENQVISAEEKRMISQMALEERVKREEEIVKTFRSMV